MAGPNVLRAINPRHNPTQDTMNRLLKPFRLKLSLAQIEEPRGRHAAWRKCPAFRVKRTSSSVDAAESNGGGGGS